MPAKAVERRSGQWHQDKIPGVSGNRRQHTDEDDHEGEDLFRRDRHKLAHEGRDQARLLGQTDTDHCNKDDPDPGEGQEVGDRRCQHEPKTVGRQKAAHRRLLRDDVAQAFVIAIKGDRRSHQPEDRRQHDDRGDKQDEDDRRVRDRVPHPFDRSQKAGQ